MPLRHPTVAFCAYPRGDLGECAAWGADDDVAAYEFHGELFKGARRRKVAGLAAGRQGAHFGAPLRELVRFHDDLGLAAVDQAPEDVAVRVRAVVQAGCFRAGLFHTGNCVRGAWAGSASACSHTRG